MTAGQRALVEREFKEGPQLREEVQDLLTTFSLSTLRLPPALAAAGDGAILPPLRPQSEGLRLEPGDMCGRYAVERVLGAGGMARVYLATDTELSTPVALKVLSEALLESSEARLRLRREAHNAAKLRGHPHIATFLDSIDVDVKGRQFPVIVMEYVDGTSCAGHLAEHALSLKRVLRWAIQIADAVEYAHDRGVLHCDLKPQNIQITTDDVVKVLDFGVARAVDRALHRRDRHRHSALHGPGADCGEAVHRNRRHLQSRRHHVRADCAAPPVQRRYLTRRRLRDSRITGPTGGGAAARGAGGARRAHRLHAGESAKAPAAVDAGVAAGAGRHPRRPRARSQHLGASGFRESGRGDRDHSGGSDVCWIRQLHGIRPVAWTGRGRFADESALFWPVWGARMLVAPLVRLAFVAVPSVLAVLVARWGLRRAGFGRTGRSPLDRLMAASTNQLAVLVLLVLIWAVNAFFFRFQDGIAAINDLVDDSTSVSVAWMRPDNFDEHNAYRFLAFLVCAGSALAWLSLARRRRALLQTPTVLLPILGGLVLAVAMGLWALPYRLLFQAELERVRLGDEICYVAGRQAPDLLLFCPKSDPPRARVVSARDPRLQSDSIIEKVFTPFNTVAALSANRTHIGDRRAN